MADGFLEGLLGSAARARLLRVFVFNYGGPMTLAELRKRAGVPEKKAKQEIRELAKIGVIKKGKLSVYLQDGKRAVAHGQKEEAWELSPTFRHYEALTKFVHEISPVKHATIVEALRGAGRISLVVLSGGFVGDPSRPADLILAGDNVQEKKLESAIRALEPKYGREIRYAFFTTPEFRYRLTIHDRLLRDILDYPHLVVLDRRALL